MNINDEEIYKGYFNQLKLKFDKINEYEKNNFKNLDKYYQERFILFDLSFIFRFLFGKTIRNDTFYYLFHNSNYSFLIKEVINVLAHYKRFFYKKGYSNLFYIFHSKPFDSELESKIVKDISKLTYYLNNVHYIGDYQFNGNKVLNLINNLNILKRTEVNNKALYLVSSNDIFIKYLWEINNIDLSNPLSIIYYKKGDIFIDNVFNYLYKFKDLFDKYYEKINIYKEFIKKPSLLDLDKGRLNKNKIEYLINKFENNDYSIENENIKNFYLDMVRNSTTDKICDSIKKEWKTKLYDKNIYELQELFDDPIKLNWLMDEIKIS